MSLEYWKANIPWSYRDVNPRPSFEERRKMRYDLQDYMHGAIGFDRWKGKDVLEVGCGAGIDAVEFARNGARVMATDRTAEAVWETQAAFVESKARGWVRQADPEDLPFHDRSFDLVYCFGVLHHIKAATACVKEFHRVLKPGGTCIAMLYNRESVLYAVSIMGLGLPFERAGNPYTKVYTKRSAAELFKGFSKVGVGAYYSVVDLPFKRKFKINIPYDGWHLLVRAIK